MVGRDTMDEYRAKMVANIARTGWTIQAVLPGKDLRVDPPFAYTVGMTENLDRHPELLMIGFDPNLMMRLMNDVGALVRGGQTFSDWSTSDRVIQRYPVVFREVPLPQARKWAKAASERYRGKGDFRLLQMFLPDMEGRFPWDPACDPKMARGQDHLLEAMPPRN